MAPCNDRRVLSATRVKCVGDTRSSTGQYFGLYNMPKLTKTVYYQGLSVDIVFRQSRPTFGDLFLFCRAQHPRFPQSGHFGFDQLVNLQFEQVDDYFGVRSLSDEGDSVSIWLYPVLGGLPVHHNYGPFEALRIEFNVLRNSIQSGRHFIRCIESISAFGSGVYYRSRGLDLGSSGDLAVISTDVAEIARFWASRGIEVGSQDALGLDF